MWYWYYEPWCDVFFRTPDSVYSADRMNELLEVVVSKLKEMRPQEIKSAYDDLISVW